jgi:hypothetical protein
MFLEVLQIAASQFSFMTPFVGRLHGTPGPLSWNSLVRQATTSLEILHVHATNSIASNGMLYITYLKILNNVIIHYYVYMLLNLIKFNLDHKIIFLLT